MNKLAIGSAVLFSLFLFCFTNKLASQNFIIPDTVCVGELLEIEYTGIAQNFCLDYSANFLNNEITITSIAGYPENEIPLFAQFIQDENGNYFGFVTNLETNNIVRLEFGDDLRNMPVSFSFPINEVAEVGGGLEGIQILRDNNQWWGFIVGGTGIFNEPFVLRLNFGNSLANIPVVENLGIIGNIDFPHDLFFEKEDNNWIGIIINKFNNSITKLEFGDNLSNTPIATNLGNVGNLFRPTGLVPIQVAGKWHFFAANSESNTISRVDFDNTLSNNPTGTNLGGFNLLDRPRDILITETCDKYIGLVLNRIGNEIILLEFGSNITAIPTATNLGNFGNFSFPHSFSNIHYTDDGLMYFVTNVDSKEIVRVFYEFPQGIRIDCKERLSDFEIVCNTPGTHQLDIVANDGEMDQVNFCKDIVVLPRPDLNLGNDTTICQGASLVLNSGNANTLWENEFLGSSFEVFETQAYIAEINNQICTDTDTIFVEFINCELCMEFPNVFTPNGDGVNDTFGPVFTCDIDLVTYQLQVYNRWGKKVFETNDPLIGWDGNIKNEQFSNDVCAWGVIFTYNVGSNVLSKTMTGNVTIIR